MISNDYYSEELHGPHEVYELGNFLLEGGETLPNARLLYKTHGKLNASKDNAILFPHMWSGTPKAMEIEDIKETVDHHTTDLAGTQVRAQQFEVGRRLRVLVVRGLSRAGIVSPGESFGAGGEGYFRVALVPTLEQIEQAIAAWERITW